MSGKDNINKNEDLNFINEELNEVNRKLKKSKVGLIDELNSEVIEEERYISENYEGTKSIEENDEEYQDNYEEYDENSEEYQENVDDSTFEDGNDGDDNDEDEYIYENDEINSLNIQRGKTNFKSVSKEEYIKQMEALNNHRSVFDEYKNNKVKKGFIIGLICIILFGCTGYIYKNKFVSNSKYAFKYNGIKIERELFDSLKSNFSTEEEIAYFIVDTLYFSNIAKEEGIAITEEDIEKYSSEYNVYKEEIALSQKLIERYFEKSENLKEEEMRKIYNEQKDLFVKSGEIEFIALDSDSLIPSEHKLSESEIKKYEINQDTIENFLSYGFYPTDLKLETPMLVSYEESEEEEYYLYFYLIKKEVNEYFTFEESEEYIKSLYDEQYGYAYLMNNSLRYEESITIEYFN